MADHTESPPPADSLLGPKCHPAGSILSLIDDPTGSASDSPAFPRLLRPHPLLRPQPHSPHPQSLVHVPRPVQQVKIRHDHGHGFSVFRRLDIDRRELLSRAWSQTSTLHVHGALLPSERRDKTSMWSLMCSSCMSWPGYKYHGENDLDLVRPPQRPLRQKLSKLRLNESRKSIQSSTLAIVINGKGAKHACLP